VRALLGLLALTLVLGAFTGAAAATTEPSLTVGIGVTLTKKNVTFTQTSVRRGYYVQFRVRNATPARRTFSVAGRTIAVPAKRSRFMVVDFLVRGRYLYSSRGRGNAIRGLFRVS
jgi:hypothetical protein